MFLPTLLFRKTKFTWRHNFSKPTFNAEIGKAYQPKFVEESELELNYFNPKISQNEQFTMILPPPNITGNLHLGHALTATIQDVIIRWKRMQGIKTVWVPGLDHAGIATQVVVEKRLWKEKRKTRHDLGRELFEQEVWKWKEQKADVIECQLKALGTSLNWSRKVFTMDPSQSGAVNAAFMRLFDAGLIYRGQQLVNWSCVLQSAISDIEVDHIEIDGATPMQVPGHDQPVEFGKLTYFAYKLHQSDEEIVVATTRPETMLGDVAVAVHPQDPRYTRFIGRNVWHPFRRQPIPVICDDFVDPNFGTGAVKVTPAHDHADFEVGSRHKLAHLQVIDEKGAITSICGSEFAGLPRFVARSVILNRLKDLQLLKGRKDHKMLVPICSRSNDVIEFLVKPQWFVKCGEMAAKAAEDVRVGRLTIEPANFERNWFQWLDNIRDWCVSRQLWWGHRIPAYFCTAQNHPGVWIAAESEAQAALKAATKLNVPRDRIQVRQDGDVLDTWFSSALLPFSCFGWPAKVDSKDYPISLMETGHDILFFWVARMVMLGNELTGCPPFKSILLHGIICDAQGRKMSKSLGNIVAPEEVIAGADLEKLERRARESFAAGVLSLEELQRSLKGQKEMFPAGIPECGADALRFTLCSHNIKSHFINFDVLECNANKLFGNKIWQATKFANHSLKTTIPEDHRSIDEVTLTKIDYWILSRLAHMVEVCNSALQDHEMHVATAAIKNFLYFEFCNVYLEATKRGLRAKDGRSLGHCWALTHCLDVSLRVLAPFMPFLAQHLHQRLERFPNTPLDLCYPKELPYRKQALEEDIGKVMEIVAVVRRLKKSFNITAKHKSEVDIVITGDEFSKYLAFEDIMEDLISCPVNVTTKVDKDLENWEVVSDRVGNYMIYLKVGNDLRKDIELDKGKLDIKKARLQKQLDKMAKMLANDNYRIKVTKEAKETHAKKISALEDELARINYLQSVAK